MTIQAKKAPLLVRLILKRLIKKNNGTYAGMLNPWTKKIWLYPYEIRPSVRWIRHERQHINQVEELGPWVFTFKYLWYNIRYGYRNNPFEVDARKAED